LAVGSWQANEIKIEGYTILKNLQMTDSPFEGGWGLAPPKLREGVDVEHRRMIEDLIHRSRQA